MPVIVPGAAAWLAQGTAAARILAYLAATYACAWLCAKVGLAIALRPVVRYHGDSWVERARLLAPASDTVSLNALMTIAFFGFVSVFPGIPPNFSTVVLMIVGGLAAYLGAARAGWGLFFHIHGRAPTRGDWWRSIAFVWLIHKPVGLIVLLLLILLPTQFNAWAVGLLALGALAIGFLLFGGAYWLAKVLGLSEPASERLAAAVEVAANRVGVRPRGAVLLRVPFANAFAFFLTRRIGVTTGALEALNDEELAAILAHELGHLNEPLGVRVSRVSGPFLLWMLAALKPLVGTFGLVPSAVGSAVVLLSISLVGRMARRMEKRADSVASSHEGDAGTYARALEKLYQFNLAPVVRFKRSRGVHPDLYDRLIASGVTPSYPRPAPPSSGWATLAMLASLLLSLPLTLLVAGILHSDQAIALYSEYQEARKYPEARRLNGMIEEAFKAHDYERAVHLCRRAAAIDERSSNPPFMLAAALFCLGRCDEAEAALSQAEARPQIPFTRSAHDPYARLASMIADCREMRKQSEDHQDTMPEDRPDPPDRQDADPETLVPERAHTTEP
jgi:Zn-dependent protease with chaperone function